MVNSEGSKTFHPERRALVWMELFRILTTFIARAQRFDFSIAVFLTLSVSGPTLVIDIKDEGR